MPSSSENDADMVIVAKTVDPVVVNRTYRYTHLTPGTKVLVTVSSPRSAVADAIIARLTAAGCKVTILEDAESSGNVGHVVAGDGAVEMIKGTVSSKADCERAVEGQAVVVHVPCHAGGGDVSASEAAKQVVEGTKNMLRAATDAAVKCFVFVSSASVVFSGQDLNACSEDIPYPARHVDRFVAATAVAEKAVLGVNGTAVGGSSAGRGILTCSVRAAVAYGPGAEERLIPGLAARAARRRRAGPSSGNVIVGDGNNVVDFVYAGNVAHAVVLAVQQLRLEAAASAGGGSGGGVGGRAFFVTDDEPVPYGDFAARVLSGLGYPSGAVGGGMSPAVATVVAFLLHIMAVLVSPIVQYRPELTARRIAEEGKTQRFDLSNARKYLEYAPLWTQEEGLDMTLQASESLRNPQAKVKYTGPFTLEEVARHSSAEDAWIIVDNKVYGVTPYLGQHPGGDALLRRAGGDATEGFNGPQHPPQAREILDRFYIGVLKTE